MASPGGGAYNAGTAHVNILPKLTKFQSELRSKLKAMNVSHTVDVGANTTKFSSQVRQALKEVPENVTVDVVADTKLAEEKIDHTARNRTTLITVRADTSGAVADIDRAVTKRNVEIGVSADTTKARKDIDDAVVKRRTTIGVDADTKKAETKVTNITRTRRVKLWFTADTKKASSALDRLLGNIKQVDRYQKRMAMMASGYSLLGVAIAGVIGPLSSMVGTLAQASGMLVTLPAMVGAAMAGIAGLAIGVNGVGKALTAAGASGGDAGKDMADAMEDAERGVIRAYRGIRDAERNLSMSQRDAKRAQEDLNKARKDALEDLQDLNNQLNDAALNEEGAVLAVARAKERLQETLRDNNASQLDVAEADHAYRSAVDSLNDLRIENSKLAEETAAANAAGIEGAEGVIAAKEGIEEADYQVLKATEALEEAHWALDDALEGVEDAMKSAASGGVDPFAEAMARLSPNAREFVLAIKALAPAWTELRLATQDALFEGMGESVTNLANRQLPVLKDGLVGINTELNRGLRSSMAEFSSELAAADFSVFLTNATTGAEGLSNAFRPVSQMWMDLNVVGSEYLPRMGRAIEEVTTKWAHQISIARQTGRLNEIIDNGIAAWGRSLRGLRDVGGILMGTLGAASASSQPFMEGISSSLSETNKWVNSFDGQTSIADFFSSATTALSAAMPVMSAIGGVIVNGLVPAIESLVVKIGPGLTELIGSFGTGFSNALPTIEAFGGAIGGLLSDVSNTMDIMQPVANVALELAEAFLSLPQPILTALGLMVAAKWLKIPGIMGKAADSVKKLGETFTKYSTNSRIAGVISREVGGQIGGIRGAALKAKGGLQTLGGYAKGAGAAGLRGFKGAASGLMSLLGGPWNIVLGVAAAAVTVFVDANARARDAQNNITEATRDGAAAYGDLAIAMSEADGALNADGIAAQARIVKGEMSGLMELGGQMDGWFYSLDGVSEFMGNGKQGWWAETFDADVQRTAEAIKNGTKDIEDVLKSMGYEMEDLDGIIAAGGPTYDQFVSQLRATSDEGAWAAQHVEKAREKIAAITTAYQNLNPEVLAAQGHFAVLADETADVASKVEALHYALLELNGIDLSAIEIQAKINKQLDTIKADTTVDAEGNTAYTGAALKEDGTLDVVGNSQSVALHDTLVSLGVDTGKLVATGEVSPSEAADQVEESLARIREATGFVDEDWTNLIAKYQLDENALVLKASVDGMSEIDAWFNAINDRVANSGDEPVTFQAKVQGAGKRQAMRDMGVGVSNFNGTTHTATLNFDDQLAKDKYAWWVETGFPKIDLANPTAEANLDDTGLMLKVEAAEYQLIGLDLARPNPLASMDISELSDEAVNALRAVGLVDEAGAVAHADMNIEELEYEQQVALSKVIDLGKEKPTPIADLDDNQFNARHDGVKRKADAIDGRKLKAAVEVDTEEASKELDTFSEKWGAFVEKFKGWFGIGDDGVRKAASDNNPRLATGGKLPETGTGTQTVDGFLGVNDQGMPVARVNAGEWVINRSSSKKHDRLLRDINNDTVDLPGYANGGVVESMERHVGALWPALVPGGKAYSTYRPGDSGHHGSGLAADFSNTPNDNDTPEMQALSQHIYTHYKDQTLELIHWPLTGFKNIKNGQDADFGHSINMDHRNHVHWALAEPLNPMPSSLNNLMGNLGMPGAFNITEEHFGPASDPAEQLNDLRASERSNPDAYGTGGKNGPNGDLPTTWTGLATHLAKPVIEGHTSDLLGLLGIGNELPGAVKAYNMLKADTETAALNGGIDARGNALRSLAEGGEETDYLAYGGPKEQSFTASMGIGAPGLGGLGNMSTTYDPSKGAEQWRPMMIAAYQNQGYEPTPEKIDAWVRQIRSESHDGDPNAVQGIWDENGIGESAGVGLGQFIPTTWADYRDPTLPDNRRDPWAMTNAMVRYGERKYGASLLDVIGHGHGYATGGFVTGPGGPVADAILARLSNGEFVQNALTTSVSRPLQEAMNQSPALASQLNEAFTSSKATASATSAGVTVENHYHIETNTAEQGMRIAAMHARQQSAAYLG